MYLAGSDKRRAEELMAMFNDPEVKAIFAARGGYGSVRLLPYLEEERLRAHPKIFMGYSDVTTLLVYFQQRFRWVVFHGPMVAREFADGPGHYDEELLRRTLMRAEPIGEIDTSGVAVLSPGVATGRLTGGCLSLLVSTLGTPYEFDATDAILFLEDYAAKPYQVDRMLTQLRDSGKLRAVRGLIFGEMTECVQHPHQDYTLVDVIRLWENRFCRIVGIAGYEGGVGHRPKRPPVASPMICPLVVEISLRRSRRPPSRAEDHGISRSRIREGGGEASSKSCVVPSATDIGDGAPSRSCVVPSVTENAPEGRGGAAGSSLTRGRSPPFVLRRLTPCRNP